MLKIAEVTSREHLTRLRAKEDKKFDYFYICKYSGEMFLSDNGVLKTLSGVPEEVLADYEKAVDYMHEHKNKAVLDKITAIESEVNESSNNPVSSAAVAKAMAQVHHISKGVLSAPGWYRIAEHVNGMTGFHSNEFIAVIKRSGVTDSGEHHTLQINSVSTKGQTIRSINSYSHTQLITKARYTYDDTKAYLEIYYDRNAANNVFVTLNDAMDHGSTWTAIVPVATQETVSGVIITATCNIPANAKVLMDADLESVIEELQKELENTTSSSHSHANKNVLDSITEEQVTQWNNQNAFSSIIVEDTALEAEAVTDTIKFTAGQNVSLVPDPENKQIVIQAEDTKYTHPKSGVTAGEYSKVTVDDKGHVTKGANPTTLAGYGITDAEVKGSVSTHNTATDAHNDIRELIAGLTTRLNALANSDDTTLDQMSEIVTYIKNNKSLIDSVTTNKVNTSDIINNLTTNSSNKVLSAAQGVALKGLIDTLQSELDTHEANTSNPHSVTKSQVGLGNVPNVATNDQTPTYTVASANAELTSGEKLSVAFGKIAKAIKSLISHLADTAIHFTSTERTKLSNIAENANNYSHPTTSGNKHIPSGGSSGQILRWSADGTAVWGADNNNTYSQATSNALGLVKIGYTESGKNYPVELNSSGQMYVNVPWTDNNTTYSAFVKSGSTAAAGLVPAPPTTAGTSKYLREDGTWQVPPDNNTTYSNMTAATSSAAGKAGLVPAPAAGKQTSFLRGDGTWVVPTNTTYSNFVKSGSGAAAGLVPAPSTTAGTSKYLREDGTWATPPNTTYSAATQSANGLMASTDKTKLDATNVAYATCSTAAGTAAKVATLSGNTNWKLTTGSIVVVKFTNSNTASNVTLNVNNTGAKSIYYGNAVYTGVSTAICGYANRCITYIYDGTYWVWISSGTDFNTTYSAMTGATSSAAGKTGLVPAPAVGAQNKFLRGDGTWQEVSTSIENGTFTLELINSANATSSNTTVEASLTGKYIKIGKRIMIYYKGSCPTLPATKININKLPFTVDSNCSYGIFRYGIGAPINSMTQSISYLGALYYAPTLPSMTPGPEVYLELTYFMA